MICKGYKDIEANMKPGDKVFAVRKGVYDALPVDKWPTVGIVSGTLQSSYFSHAVDGPHPPRHLLADNDRSGNAWDGPWWDLDHWTVCTTEEEALLELESLKRARIARAEAELEGMRALLSDRSGISHPDGMEVRVPAEWAGEVPPVGTEVRISAKGTLLTYYPDEEERRAVVRIGAVSGTMEPVRSAEDPLDG